MSKLVFGVTKIIPKAQEDAAKFDLVVETFREAYSQLRTACPGGDLRIHLSVEANSAEEVGAVLDERECEPKDFSDLNESGEP